jgi:hypothetical protein
VDIVPRIRRPKRLGDRKVVEESALNLVDDGTSFTRGGWQTEHVRARLAVLIKGSGLTDMIAPKGNAFSKNETVCRVVRLLVRVLSTVQCCRWLARVGLFAR